MRWLGDHGAMVRAVLAVIGALLGVVATLSHAELQRGLRTDEAMLSQVRQQQFHVQRQRLEAQGAARTGPVPAEIDVTGTLRDLATVATGAGLDLEQVRVLPAEDQDRQDFQITGVATPETVATMLAGIERHERLMVLLGGTVQARDEERVAFEFLVATFAGGGGRR